MKIIKGEIKEDSRRDLYWTRITFVSDNDSKKTQILTCASSEYLSDFLKIPIDQDQKLQKEHFEKWLKLVEKKWLKLNEDIFNQDAHYDVYAISQEGEANGYNFLLKLVK